MPANHHEHHVTKKTNQDPENEVFTETHMKQFTIGTLIGIPLGFIVPIAILAVTAS
jgi:hypothetical protein